MVHITPYTTPITRIAPKWIYIEYTVLKIFSPFRIFSNFRLPWKTRFALKFFTSSNINFLSFRIFEQLELALKNRVALKIFNIFYHSVLLSNLRCPENFQAVGSVTSPSPPRMPMHTSAWTSSVCFFLWWQQKNTKEMDDTFKVEKYWNLRK